MSINYSNKIHVEINRCSFYINSYCGSSNGVLIDKIPDDIDPILLKETIARATSIYNTLDSISSIFFTLDNLDVYEDINQKKHALCLAANRLLYYKDVLIPEDLYTTLENRINVFKDFQVVGEPSISLATAAYRHFHEMQLQRKIRLKEIEKQNNSLERKSEIGHIYVIKANDLYKIGKTKNVKQRLAGLQYSFSFRLELICSKQLKDYHMAELALHEQFKEKRKNGEWFALEENDIEYIKTCLGENIYD